MGQRSGHAGAQAVAAHAGDYWQFMTAGREVQRRAVGILQGVDPAERDEIAVLSFRFEDQEWARLRVQSYDMITQMIPAGAESFDLSVWIEGWYFFPGVSYLFHLADIVQRTRVGGHILISPLVSPEVQAMLGLRHRRRVGGDRIWQTAAHLYQRTAPTRQVRELVAQKEGISIALPRR